MPRLRRRAEADFAEEVRAHLEIEAAQLEGEGLEPEAARALAARRFGNVARAHERFYEANRSMWLDRLAQDVRSAARSARRFPVSCAIAIISLAAGIGAVTSALLLRNAIFHAPPPLYLDTSTLDAIELATPQQLHARVPAGLYRLWMQDDVIGQGLAAGLGSVPRDIRFGTHTEPAAVHAVTQDLFARLGVRPVLGVEFDQWPTDRPAPAILSHGIWQRLFGGRSDIVGQALWIEDVPHTIIGVMPERFWFGNIDSPVWTVADIGALPAETPLDVVLRRPPGTADDMVQGRLRAGASAYASGLTADRRDVRVLVEPVAGTLLGRQVGPMVVALLSGAVVLVLLIACTNVAVLLMAQWSARDHEIAVRASLGGATGRLVRMLLAESLLIAVAGGVLGVVTTLAFRAMAVRTSRIWLMFDLDLNPQLLFLVGSIVLAAGLGTGLAPAVMETRRALRFPMRARHAGDRERRRWRHALVVFEIGATTALLVVTTAMLTAYARALDPTPGFDPQPLLFVRVENADGVPATRIVDHLRTLPGVEAAEASTVVPYAAAGPLETLGRDDGRRLVQAELVATGPDFFTTLGIDLRGGRPITAADTAAAPRVAVINVAVAAALWPGQNPVGETISLGEVARQVVGVVDGYAHNSLRPIRPAVFVPLAQLETPPTRVDFLVRARDNAARLAPVLRREVQALDAGSVPRASAMSQIISIIGQEILAGTVPMMPLVATGLLLTATGIFGVLAFAVSRRSAELAVRMALGATRAAVTTLLVRDTVRLLAWGALLGLGATFALTRMAQGRGGLFDSPGWPAFAVPLLLVVSVGLAATWIPLIRARTIDPARLLKTT